MADPQPEAPIVVEDDYEARFEADLQAALVASQASAQPPHRSPSPATSVASSIDSPPRPNGLLPPTASKPAPPPQASTSSSSGTESLAAFRADRKRLEEERLARQKRRRDESGQPEETDSEERRPAKRATPSDASSSSSPRVPFKPQATQPSGELFWDGEVRQTANLHVNPSKNGQDGKPVFRLSDTIGDVSYSRCVSLVSESDADTTESADQVRHRVFVCGPDVVDQPVFLTGDARHHRRTAGQVRGQFSDCQAQHLAQLGARYALFQKWVRCYAREGSLFSLLGSLPI